MITIHTMIDQSMIDSVKIPKSVSDVPVIGSYLSSLAQRFVKVSDDEQLMLANAFERNESGKLVLRFHNPFVEAAIFAVIEAELRKIVKDAATAKRKQEEETKEEKAAK